MNKQNNFSKISGELTFSGDKSLSHRAAILAAIAKGKSTLENYLPAEDTINTLKAFEAAGVKVSGTPQTGIEIDSPGLSGICEEKMEINVGNSGTAARLLLGLFAGLPGCNVVIDGDKSLRKRPMGRVTTPLQAVGAEFEPMDKLPISIIGRKLLSIVHTENIGSAQVKSAIMLAAIASGVSLRLEEKKGSRNHTEYMLEFAGVSLSIEETSDGGHIIEMEPPYTVQPRDYKIWGDISSASFFIVLGLLVKEGELIIRDVLLNPYRDRFIDILQEMGGNIEVIEKDHRCGEKGGDIIVRPSKLHGIEIDPKDIPGLIDELPILSIAGAFCDGVFQFKNAGELRFKESDRIAAMIENLNRVGIPATELNDGLRIEGSPDSILNGGVKSQMDHRKCPRRNTVLRRGCPHFTRSALQARS